MPPPMSCPWSVNSSKRASGMCRKSNNMVATASDAKYLLSLSILTLGNVRTTSRRMKSTRASSRGALAGALPPFAVPGAPAVPGAAPAASAWPAPPIASVNVASMTAVTAPWVVCCHLRWHWHWGANVREWWRWSPRDATFHAPWRCPHQLSTNADDNATARCGFLPRLLIIGALLLEL
ncbi:TPA: hypothetical protein N0F65_008866 [Lagenidium giganteum]|uniref:Uncharacterized protein n=1 Tax=Lagenidium giganteum TaxID=4803 RepID=A0AAV2YKS9_9STRA|nr:TPA: hypothetical protein N0F65_008866 [Lagenidium giganteum]